MRLYVLLDDVAASGQGAAVPIPDFNQADWSIAQVEMTGTATVDLYGRTSPNMPWQLIHTFNGSDAIRPVVFPYMMADVSSYTDGTVRVEIAN